METKTVDSVDTPVEGNNPVMPVVEKKKRKMTEKQLENLAKGREARRLKREALAKPEAKKETPEVKIIQNKKPEPVKPDEDEKEDSNDNPADMINYIVDSLYAKLKPAKKVRQVNKKTPQRRRALPRYSVQQEAPRFVDRQIRKYVVV
jgi:hypothetical protein